MGGGWAPGLQALTEPSSLFPHPLPSSDYGGKAQRPLLGKRTLPGPLETCGRPFPRSVSVLLAKLGGPEKRHKFLGRVKVVPGQSLHSKMETQYLT